MQTSSVQPRLVLPPTPHPPSSRLTAGSASRWPTGRGGHRCSQCDLWDVGPDVLLMWVLMSVMMSVRCGSHEGFE